MRPESKTDMSGDLGEPGADWPYASLFFLGYFGSRTPEGKRLRMQSLMALGVILVSVIALRAEPQAPLLRFAGAIGFPLGVAAMCWAFAHYLRALDELSRMIQMKACAFSYAVALVAASGMTGVLAAAGAFTSASIAPIVFMAVLVVAEMVRGITLVVLARSYR